MTKKNKKIKLTLIPLLVLVLMLSGCRKKKDDMDFRIVLSKHFTAIHKKDYKALASTLYLYDEILNRFGEEGASKIEFKKQIDSIYEDYKKDLEKGEITFDPYGIKAAKIMGLGKGFYYLTVKFEMNKEDGYIILKHSFSYDKFDYSIYPLGTKLFFLGCPLGKIYTIVRGQTYKKNTRFYLKEIQTKWYFKRDLNNNWKIVKMEVLKDTAKCQKSFRIKY
ncbi:hypothetical protein TTHT_1452 [Thermotomaculum hydrothermale]|uniref:Uncharacterized protein n=1 Tax=Thermotomaculum hydrothermale TaxID=981385 RepID=A0A7R6PMS4_9BACT|nr:hypothetical protein [Thermotomaculum hydrothermale]BBB32962.1 hypothetical protein TTHT_1452 [Thermotomaculum hydrothermale]